MVAAREITVKINGDASELIATAAMVKRKLALMRGEVRELLDDLEAVERKLAQLGPR